MTPLICAIAANDCNAMESPRFVRAFGFGHDGPEKPPLIGRARKLAKYPDREPKQRPCRRAWVDVCRLWH